MPGDACEVAISCQEWEAVPARVCSYEKIAGPGSDTFRAASSSKSCRGYIGWTSQLKQWVWIEERQKLIDLLGRAESVEQFLQNSAYQK